MKQSRLKNLFNNERLTKTGSTARCNRITVLIYWEKLKKNYFTNLNIKDITDSKTFSKTIKPNFSEKGFSSSKIILFEKESILNGNKNICITMNDYFINLTKT